MIEIKLTEKNTLLVGQKASLSLHEHGSVGIKSKAFSNDESIISKDTTSWAYNKATKEIQPGGDSGGRTYIFKANKIGTTTITTQRIFRGRLEEENTIEIIVSSEIE